MELTSLPFRNPDMNIDFWIMDFAPGAEGNVDVDGQTATHLAGAAISTCVIP